MPARSQILVVASTALASEVTRQLTPRSRYMVTHAAAVTIGTFVEHNSPDLAILGGDDVEGGVAEAVRELGRFQKKFPIILIDPKLPLNAVVPGIGAVLPKLQASGPLDSLVSALLDAFRYEQPLRTKGVPLGVVERRAMPGEHIALMLHDDNDLRQAIPFWTVADATDHFVLIASRAASRLYEERFALEGLDFRKLQKQGRLTILEAEQASAAMLRQITRCITRATERGTQLLRIIGTVSGWAPRKISRVTLCEHVLTDIMSRLPAIMLCPYRADAFNASALCTQALETHPLVISGNRLLRSSWEHLGQIR